MKLTTMSLLSIVCLMGVILGIHANGYGGGYSYYPVSQGYYGGGGGGGGGGFGNGGFLALIGGLFLIFILFFNNSSSTNNTIGVQVSR